ncbi:MAG TPA: ABC transporter substrate-binding protein [Dongiaceae bacterium]|nr:ABC transporter substrate-binding protein [Dongiaceae bacterium]
MRKFRAAALAVSSMVALAVALPALADDSIAVASYGGVYQDALRKAFYDPTAKDLNIKINEFTLSGITDIRTQVKAGAIQWDVVELYGGQCQQAADEGLLEPLDYTVIHADGIPKDLVQSHWLGFTAYSTVLAYNKEKYKDNPPKTWADFWDTKKFPGTRAVSGYGPDVNIEIALMADGVAKDKLYPADLDRAFKKLQDLKPDIAVFWQSGAQQAQLAQNQEVDMEAVWVSRIDAAIKGGAPFAYTYNQGVVDVECLVVPKGSKHKDLAMKVINDFVKPDLQANLPQYIPYGPANQKAYETGKITPEMTKNSVTAPDNFALQVVMNKPWWAANGQKAQERWDAFIQK